MRKIVSMCGVLALASMCSMSAEGSEEIAGAGGEPAAEPVAEAEGDAAAEGAEGAAEGEAEGEAAAEEGAEADEA